MAAVDNRHFPAKEYATFPKDFLNEVVARMPNEPSLHLLRELAKEAPLERIQAVVDQADLFRGVSLKGRRVSPLLLAIDQGCFQIVQLLCEKKTDDLFKVVNDVDEKGWGPLHKAAIRSDRAFAILIAAGADPTQRTHNGCTPMQFFQMVHKEPLPRSLESLSFEFAPGDVRLAMYDMPQFLEKTGLIAYRDNPLLPPGVRFQKVLLTPLESRTDYHVIKQIDEKGQTTLPPKLSIRSVPELKDASTGPYGLFSDEEIPAGTCVGYHSGIIMDEEENADYKSCLDLLHSSKSTAYKMKWLNSEKYGNAIRFVQCGFPNTHLLPPSPNHPFSPMLVALRDIAPGEQILCSYGPNAVYETLHSPQPLFQTQELLAFFQSGLRTTLERCEANAKRFGSQTRDLPQNQHIASYVSAMREFAPVTYVLENPTALLFLHCNHVVPIKDWSEFIYGFLVKENFPSTTIEAWALEYQGYIWALRYIVELVVSTESAAGDKSPLITHWISERLGRLSVDQIVRGLQMIRTFLKMHPTENLEDFLSSVNCLEGANPFTDEALEEVFIREVRITVKDDPERILDIIVNITPNQELRMNPWIESGLGKVIASLAL